LARFPRRTGSTQASPWQPWIKSRAGFNRTTPSFAAQAIVTVLDDIPARPQSV
jgi:hypothetical protein